MLYCCHKYSDNGTILESETTNSDAANVLLPALARHYPRNRNHE